MERHWWWTIYSGLIFLTVINADSCGGGCRGRSKDSVYNFEEGTVYKYEVDGLSVTQLPGSQNDVSKLSIKATAEISAQAQCSYVLQLSNVQVSGPDGKHYDGLSTDCAKPVTFNFNNGQLTPELCTDKDDNGAALNIKRAVISLFQTSKEVASGSNSDSSYETDIFGTCPTNYVISREGSKVSVSKSRNLNRCAHRENFDFPMLSTPYFSQKTDYQTSPLMAAELSVEQDIEKGILKKATSEEEYQYRPLLTAGYAAKITNKVSLKFQGSIKGVLPASGKEQQSIIFEPPHPRDGAGNANTIIKALQKVVSEIDPTVDQGAAKDFLELVDVLEHGTKADILTVYSQIKSGAGFKDKEVAKNLLLDGLLFAGSAESVEAAAELLRNNEISEANSVKWYLDLNFVKHVSKGALKAVTPLLDGDVPHQAYLGIGALAGKFCRQHDCENVPEFQQLLKKLAKPVLDGCKVKSVDEENNVIASLKGLANVQLITDDVAAKLTQCAEDSNVKTRIRSAALSAYRTNDLFKKSAIKIFKDVDEDAELRIKAYLALVSCPCAEVADVVKETIDKEPINQVGSYVVSHLRNLRASTNPDKEAAKHFLGQIIPKKRFPFDVRKFSQNRELSYSFDALNIGAVGEANTIYSQKSYLPRFVNLNLTSNIFGHSFNFLEVAARAENLEYILEKYFGPKGEYNKSPNEILEETAEAGEKVYSQYQKRGKRSVSQQQINDIKKKVKFGVDYDDQSLDLDLSLKVFGAEIGWFKLNGEPSPAALKKLYNKVTGRVEESVDKLRNYDVDYKKARTFIDATVTYPTALGLALKVKVLAGSAVNIKVDSKLDIKEIVRAIKDKNVDLDTDIKVQIIPSVAIELNSLLAIDADIVQTGVKVNANIHSSTGIDIALRILDGSGVDLKVGLPVKNQELVSFKSNIVSIVREKDQAESTTPITFNAQRTEYGGCFDQLSSLIGLTFCGEISMPIEGLGLFSPAYGPSNLVLRVEKEDESLTSYHFKAYYNDKEPKARSFEVILDTPNSKINRKVALIVKASHEPRPEFSLYAVSPFKNISVEGFITDTDSEQSLTAKLINDNQEYSLKVGADVSGDSNHKKYEPILEYKEPQGGKQWSFVGHKGGTKGGKSHQTLGVTGAVIVDKTPGSSHRKYELKSVTITTQYTKFTLDGDITVDKDSLETDLKVSYDKNSVKINSKLQCTGNKISAEVDLVPHPSKEFGLSLKWNFEKEKHKIANNLVLIHGPDLNSDTAKFTLVNSIDYNLESYKDFKFETKNSLSYPLMGVTSKLEVELSSKEVEVEVQAAYADFNLEGKLEAKTGIKGTGDYDIEFSAKILETSVQLAAKHDIISDSKSKFTNSLELKPGGKYQLNAIVTYDLKGKDINQAIDAELKFPYDPKIVKLNYGLKNNKEECTIVFILTGGNKPIVEVSGSIEKSSKPEGSFKMYVPSYIDSSGAFKFDGHKGTGTFSVEFPKSSRQVEGKGELYMTRSNYKGFSEIKWDAKKDPSKKIRIETDTDYSENSVDSKSSLQVLDYKTEFNIKGNQDGKFTDGTLTGEAELCLPSGRVIAGKVDRKVHLKPSDNEVQIAYELYNYERKGSQPQKLVFKLAGKNIDLKKLIFDGQADISYTSMKQETLNLHIVGKKVPQGDNWNIAGEGSISGSLVNTMKLKVDSEVSDLFLKGELINDSQFPPAQYHVTANDATTGISIDINGKANGYLVNNDLRLTLPSDLPVTSVEWSSSNYLNYKPQQGEFLKVKYDNAFKWNGNKFLKVNVEVNNEAKGVNGKLEWESHVASIRTLTGRITQEKVDDFYKTDVESAFKYDGNTADIVISVNAKGDGSIINGNVVANVPNKGKFTADLKHKDIKTSDTERTRDSVLVITHKDQTVTVTSFVQYDKPNSFAMKFLVEAPQGKSGAYVKVIKKGIRHYDIEQKYNWISRGGGNLDLDVEFDFEDLKDFTVKVAADSPKLEINKFEFEAGSKAAVKTAGKNIVFSAKNAERALFSGRANYKYEDKLPESFSLDGNGNLKVGDNSYPLKLKFDYENGLAESSVLLSIDAKPYSLVSVLNRKEPDLKVSHKFCKDSICGKLEFVQITVFSPKESTFSLERDLTIDVEPFFSNCKKFNYKNLIKKQGPHFDHKISVVYGTYTSDYYAYIKEQEAGAVLTLPTRVIALELTHDSDLGKGKVLPDNFEIAFYPNKNNADEKTCLSYKSDISKFLKNAATGQFSSELRFAAPGIKDFVVKTHGEVSADYNKVEGSLDIDVFNKKANKIVIDYSRSSKNGNQEFSFDQLLKIHSKGQGIDLQVNQAMVATRKSFSFNSNGYYINTKKVKKEGSIKIEADENGALVYVKIPEGVILNIEEKLTNTQDGFKIFGKYEILGKTITETIVYNKNRITYNGKFNKDTLEGVFSYIPRQSAEYKASLNNKPLANLEIKLDEANFLKTTYNYDVDTIKTLFKSMSDFDLEIYRELAKILKAVFERVSNDFSDRLEDLREAVPNFKPFVNAYTTQLKKLKEEIENDENLKDLLAAVRSYLVFLLDHVTELYQAASKAAEGLLDLVNETWEKLNETFKKLLPKLNEAYGRIVDAVERLLEEFYKVVTNVLEFALDEIKKFDAEIKELFGLCTDFLHEIGSLVSRTVIAFHAEVEGFIDMLKEQIEALPIVAMIRERIKELKEYQLPDHALAMYSEFVTVAKQGAPTPDVAAFIDSVASYIEKLLRHQPVDDTAALKEIYKNLILAVKSLIPIVFEEDPGAVHLGELIKTKVLRPFQLYQPPRGGFRLNLLTLLQSPDLPSLSEIYQTYKPTRCPMDYLPPYKAYASYADSTEIVTFDGRQVSFKGSCGYILVQDFVDGNFSVAASLENGKVKSLTVTDKENIVEIQSDHSVIVNGKPCEYPVMVGDITVWRKYHSVGLYSEAGLKILCDENLEHCSFILSGFYFSKTRGLLGTYNNEPYDDLAAPDGKICGSTNEFGNVWKTSPQCSDIPQLKHSHEHVDECTQYFTSGSPIQSCFSNIDPANYRKSCDHKVQEAQEGDKKSTLCNILEAYVGACTAQGVHIKLPPECISCKAGTQTLNYGETASVKIPQNAADIVFLVEELEYNEDVYKQLILQLLSTLSKDLKEKGITDIKYALIGFGGPNQEWPAHYTTNGEIEFSGKAKITFGKPVNDSSRSELVDKIRFLKKQVDIELGNTPWHKALEELMFYPFRADAVKAVVSVYAKPCETSVLPISTIPVQQFAGKLAVIKSGIKLILITPLKDLEIEGKDAKTAANVVGFDTEAVYMQGEAKKKVLRGDEESYKNLKYTSDRCIDFTQSVNGAVFSSDNFIQGKPGLRKNFLQVLSDKITDDLTGTEIQQECWCELDRIFPITRCKVTSRKEKEQLAKNVKGVKG